MPVVDLPLGVRGPKPRGLELLVWVEGSNGAVRVSMRHTVLDLLPTSASLGSEMSGAHEQGMSRGGRPPLPLSPLRLGLQLPGDPPHPSGVMLMIQADQSYGPVVLAKQAFRHCDWLFRKPLK